MANTKLSGDKLPKVCKWLFEVVGAQPDDVLHDLFPGTGAVTKAWVEWRENVLATSEAR